MEIRLQDSSFLSEVAVKITWRRPDVKFGRNEVKEETTQKNYQDEDKKSAIIKKLILRLGSLISKLFQLKTIPNQMFLKCLKYQESLIPLDFKFRFHLTTFRVKLFMMLLGLIGVKNNDIIIWIKSSLSHKKYIFFVNMFH